MDDPLVVGGGKSIGQRHSEVEELPEREPTFRYQPLERLAVDKLHGDEMDALVLLDRVDGDDIGVAQGRNGPRLAREALEPLLAAGELGRQHFDRHLAAELGVLGPIHLPHAALAQLGGDLVVRNRLSDQIERIISAVVYARAASRLSYTGRR
jgi:hypothetical protein